MNLMIIDDHEIVRDGLSMLLQQSFCIDGRICACDGYEAVKAAVDFPADLVLLDLSMPGGLDGMTTLERLRKLLPEAKIVIFSMHDDIGYQKKAYEAGADGYLIKQLKRDDLIQSLDKILANQKVFDTHIWRMRQRVTNSIRSTCRSPSEKRRYSSLRLKDIPRKT